MMVSTVRSARRAHSGESDVLRYGRAVIARFA